MIGYKTAIFFLILMIGISYSIITLYPNSIETADDEKSNSALGLFNDKITYYLAGIEKKIEGYKEEYRLKEEYEDKLVYNSYKSAYIAGAKDDIKFLDNNEFAKDVTYSEVISFVLEDETDKVEYNYSSFVCADFAEMLHNNAEAAGIKCAYVSVSATGISDDGVPYEGHALNAFNTTDKGLIYIDSTGSMDNKPMDNIATIKSNGIYYKTINETNYSALIMYLDVKNVEVIW